MEDWFRHGTMRILRFLIMKFKDYLERLLSISHYLLASLIPLILNLVTNPLVAKNMSPEDYAIVGYYKSFNTLILPLILFYVLHYYTKRYYELDDEKRIELKAMVFMFLIYASLIIAVICFVGICIYTVLFNTNSKIPLFPYSAINVFSLPLSGIYALALVDYRMSRHSKDYLYLSLNYAFWTVALLLLLVVVIKLGAFGNLISILIVNFLFFVICIYKNRALFSIKVEKSLFKDMIVFCWPLTLAAMLGFFSNGYDRVYLERLGNVTELGYYVVAFSIVTHINVFSNAVGSTFQPDIYQSIASRNFRRYIQFAGIILLTNLITVLVFIPLAPFVIDILTAGRYLDATEYLQITSISAFAGALYYTISQFTIAIGFTKIALYNKILTSVLCVLMFKLMIVNWQFTGAAWGLSLTFVLSSLGNLFFLYLYKKDLRLRWNTPES